MDKEVLYQYIDACVLVRETEQEIRQLRQRRREIVTDKVKGSSYDFPFGEISYTIHGIPYEEQEQEPELLEVKEELLEKRKAAAEAVKVQVEAWLNTVSPRMQRIIRYKVFEGLTWNQVAVRMGRRATADSVRIEFQRFMAEK